MPNFIVETKRMNAGTEVNRLHQIFTEYPKHLSRAITDLSKLQNTIENDKDFHIGDKRLLRGMYAELRDNLTKVLNDIPTKQKLKRRKKNGRST